MSEEAGGVGSGASAAKPTFYIQVGPSMGGSVVPHASFDEFVEGSGEQFRQVARVVETAGNAFVDRMRKLAVKPTMCAIEFGVNAGGEAGYRG